MSHFITKILKACYSGWRRAKGISPFEISHIFSIMTHQQSAWLDILQSNNDNAGNYCSKKINMWYIIISVTFQRFSTTSIDDSAHGEAVKATGLSHIISVLERCWNQANHGGRPALSAGIANTRREFRGYTYTEHQTRPWCLYGTCSQKSWVCV